MLEKQTPHSSCIATEDRKSQLKEVLKCNSDFLLSLRNELKFNQRSLIPQCSFLFHPDNLGRLYPEHHLVQIDSPGGKIFKLYHPSAYKPNVDKAIDHATIGLATSVADGLHNLRGLFVGQHNLKKKEDSKLYNFVLNGGNEARGKIKGGLMGLFKPGLVKMGLRDGITYRFNARNGGKLEETGTSERKREYT